MLTTIAMIRIPELTIMITIARSPVMIRVLQSSAPTSAPTGPLFRGSPWSKNNERFQVWFKPAFRNPKCFGSGLKPFQ